MKYRCICEVCGAEDVLTKDEMFQSGWDYPPGMYAFAVVSPRKCPNCPIDKTVWWQLAIVEDNNLNEAQMATVKRIMAEPKSIEVSE